MNAYALLYGSTDQGVLLGPDSTPVLGATFTVEAYFRLSSVSPSTGDVKPIFRVRNASQYLLGLNVFSVVGGGETNDLHLHLNDDTVEIRRPDLRPNVNYHVAVTYDGANLRMYLDGDLVGVAAVSFAGTGSTPGAIGCDPFYGWPGFRGVIDEFRISDVALTPAEFLNSSGIAPWPTSAGGNGHYYEAVHVPGGISWTAANTAARQRNFIGITGHLATITSAAENDFVFSQLASNKALWNGQGPWLGGFRDPNDPAYSFGRAAAWHWVTQEPWGYTNWAVGEPSGGFPVPTCLQYFIDTMTGQGPAPFWNDTFDVNPNADQPVLGYIVEYPAPCDIAIASQPQDATKGLGEAATFSATVVPAVGTLSRWRRYGVALADGPTGTGSTISGATTNQLSISNVGPPDAGAYDVVVSNACSATTSRGAFLTLIPSCATQQAIPMLLAANKNSDNVAAISTVTGLSIRPVAEAADKLDYANGLAVDLAGKAFVSSAANGRVQRFDLRNRELELQFSGGGLSGPVDVLLRPTTLLVSSYGTNQIKEYNLDTGLWIRNLVAAGSGGLSGPTGLFARPNGNLLVCSENSGQVLEYDANGVFVRVAASGGGLSIPADVLLDAAGNLLVSSFATDSVKKFDPNGAYVGDFVASGSGGLDEAGGLCWSPGGNLWVASRFTSFTGQILEYDGQTGAFVRVFSSGSHLNQPTYIAVAYLCDPDCNGNGVLDQWDIELQRSGDCDHDGVPDECQNIVPSGTAVTLDGVDDHLTAGVRPALNLLNNFTIEAWVRPAATAGVQRFLSNGFFSPSDPNETAGYGFGMLDGKLVFTTYGRQDYLPNIPTLATGNWSHVAMSMNSGNDVKFYINGNLAAFELGLLPARSSPHAFNMGRNSSSDPNRQQPFGGVIDEVRVWSTVRTDLEVLDHFAVPLVGNEPNLVAYWQFDEGTGPTAFDLAGANDATLVGAAWVVSSCARVLCLADADHDGDVDQDDLDLVLFFFGQAVPPGTNGDLTGDGVVTQDDLDPVLFEFGLLCL